MKKFDNISEISLLYDLLQRDLMCWRQFWYNCDKFPAGIVLQIKGYKTFIYMYLLWNLHSGDVSPITTCGWSSCLTTPGACLNIKPSFQGIGISMLKIRRSRDHLIFNMGIPILVRRHLHIEMAPRMAVECLAENKLKRQLTCIHTFKKWSLEYT